MTAAMPVTLTTAEAGAQSLASGTVGHALLAAEQAVNGAGDWATAHRLIQQTAARVDAALHTGLYYGAPAIAFLLHTTTVDGRDRYPAARQALDRHVPVIAGQLPALADLVTNAADNGADSGFLNGGTGIALAIETIRTGQTCTRRDACLLIA